ncbi:MAG: hypothetical protein P0S95_05900 [Rhabdochlamydiaceae bacterium]|nr:hypothetical protein [Candidatus Amphrikana amoebophyrae]
MKINAKFLSLPPHISTSWSNITSIQVVQDNGVESLAIILKDGHIIRIPGLAQEIINLVFLHHSEYLEKESSTESNSISTSIPQGTIDLQKAIPNFGIPLQFGVDGLQGIGGMQHNPEQANSPDLPPEILKKISQVASALGVEDDALAIPAAEPHCNCMFCQVARAMTGNEKESTLETEEVEAVSEEDLKFREFDIDQKGDKLYEVTNPLDKSEQFQVYLGSPVGCTCGKKDCEHIKAVLNS